MLVRIVRRCFAKIRISRAQKQFLFAFCRGGVSETELKIRIYPYRSTAPDYKEPAKDRNTTHPIYDRLMDLCIRNCGIPRPIKEFLEIPIKIEHCEVFPLRPSAAEV